MIVLIVASAWMLALVLVAGLCVAARRGDRAVLEDRARERAGARWDSQAARPAQVTSQPPAPAPLRHAA
jgi:hypothetical protein